MEQDENPYQAPQNLPGTILEEPHSKELVDKGLQVYLAIAAFLLAIELGLPFFMRTDPNLPRIVVLIALLIAGWRGHGWAITLLGLGFAFGTLLGVVSVFQAISSESMIAIGLTLLLTLVYVSILLALLYSPGLKAFFQSQDEHRRERSLTDPRMDNVQNIVTLTADAAELVRDTLKERNYPAESVLRVTAEPDCLGVFDVQYDLPANDGRDWVGESSGIVILVDKEVSGLLQGVTIDAENGQYVFREAESEA